MTKKTNFKKLGFLASLGMLAMAPVALAASCGSSSSSASNTPGDAQVNVNTIKTLPSDISSADQAVLQALTVQPGSLHNAVAWNQISRIALSKDVSSVQFLSGNFSDAEAAHNATTWSDNLPLSIEYGTANRHLWVRVNPADGVTFKNPYLDLTSSSRIQDVKSLIDAHPKYVALDLKDLINLRGNQSDFKVDESKIEMLEGLTLKYKFKNKLYSAVELKDEVTKQFETIVENDIKNITVTTALGDAAHFELRESKTAPVVLIDSAETTKPTIDKVNSFVFSTVVTADPLELFESIGFNGEQARYSIYFVQAKDAKNVLKQPTYRARYLLGNYPTKEDAMKDIDKASTLSEAKKFELDPDHSKRNMWIFVDDLPGYIHKNKIVDATEKSGIRNLVTKVALAEKYINLDILTPFTHNGKVDITQPVNAIDLPFGTKLKVSLAAIYAPKDLVSSQFEWVVPDPLKIADSLPAFRLALTAHEASQKVTIGAIQIKVSVVPVNNKFIFSWALKKDFSVRITDLKLK